MRTREEAVHLARELVEVTRAMGRQARSLVTAMDEPLGYAVGNASETAEAFSILHRVGPPDLTEVTRAVGAAMLVLCGVARERHEAEARMDRALETGEGIRRAERLVQAQGGDPRVVTDPSRLTRAKTETRVASSRDGFVAAIDGRAIGTLLIAMGGGRARKEDSVDPAVGIRLLKKRGAPVAAGETVALIEAHRDAPEWAAAAAAAYTIAERAPEPAPLILEESAR
jgi:pyrimidine-nucleoside phosphorylase